MAFCTRCGHRNPDAGRFCEECGHPLGAQPSPAPSPPAPRTVPMTGMPSGPTLAAAPLGWPPRRVLLLAAAALLSVLALGLTAWLLLAPEGASKANFERALTRGLEQNPALLRERFCLDNFNYAANPVDVNRFDTVTNNWLQFLVQAGVYSGPELVQEQHFFRFVQNNRYRWGEQAAQFIRDGRLCFAQGVELVEIKDFSQPSKLADFELVHVKASLRLHEPAPWSQTEQARQLNPAFMPEFSQGFVLVLREGRWELANPNEIAALQQAHLEGELGQNKGAAPADPSPSGWFGGLLSFLQPKPFLGTWRSENSIDLPRPIEIELKRNSIRSVGQRNEIPVTYEFDGNRVLVKQDGEIELVFEMINNDRMRLRSEGRTIDMVRVR